MSPVHAASSSVHCTKHLTAKIFVSSIHKMYGTYEILGVKCIVKLAPGQ